MNEPEHEQAAPATQLLDAHTADWEMLGLPTCIGSRALFEFVILVEAIGRAPPTMMLTGDDGWEYFGFFN